jgi:hypothetical protein
VTTGEGLRFGPVGAFHVRGPVRFRMITPMAAFVGLAVGRRVCAALCRLRAEVKEPRCANQILQAAASYFAAELGRPLTRSCGSSTSTTACSGSS